jgi:radical SAM superfamily enzyme YgiQ (UPF0313 family)
MTALVDVSFFPRAAKPLASYRKYWAARFGTAKFLPMNRAEMEALGWDSCDVILVTGDAYVDHPSFGMAVIGRMLESQGFRVGIIAQPDWQSADPFKVLGKPNLFYGVTAGNMDSMINRYTADRKIRSDDAYTPGDVAGKRPDRAALVYSQRCREAYKDVPIILGGIEGSLRRIAHYDYWSDKVRRSILVDAKADLLLYGNAERALVEIAHRIAAREPVQDITDVRGTAFVRRPDDETGKGWFEIDSSGVDEPGRVEAHVNPYQTTSEQAAGQGASCDREDSPHPNPLPQGEGVKNRGSAVATEQRYTTWTFGELPELMEIRKGGQVLIGFPALVDASDAVTIEVFDEPEMASAKHRAGLRRLVALQIRDALKYLEKNLPDLQKMAVAYMTVGRAADGTGGGTMEELREVIIALALDRAFLLEPLPANEQDFKRRIEEGRGRLTLIANEVARLAATILAEYALAARKIKDTKGFPDAVADAAQQLQRLMPKRFLASTPWSQLQHFARYLKAIQLRLEKLRSDPVRDAAKAAELKPLEQRYWRLLAERKGSADERMQEFRWLLEELRVSFFAQELRTPQPVSVKRLEKAWAQLTS